MTPEQIFILYRCVEGINSDIQDALGETSWELLASRLRDLGTDGIIDEVWARTEGNADIKTRHDLCMLLDGDLRALEILKARVERRRAVLFIEDMLSHFEDAQSETDTEHFKTAQRVHEILSK
jgi:hypothetical protein